MPVYRLVTEGTIEEKIIARTIKRRSRMTHSGLERADALDFDQLVALLQQ